MATAVSGCNVSSGEKNKSADPSLALGMTALGEYLQGKLADHSNPEIVRALAEIHHTCTGTTKRAQTRAIRQFGKSLLSCLK
jgi:hypothetical protein